MALVAHPDDERYQPLFGTEVVTPLFGVRVPIRAHELADPEKGSGIAMICTFGDVTDVIWWRALSLPVRAIIQPNGTLKPIAWGSEGWESVDAARAQAAYDQLANLSAAKARAKIVELLKETGDLVGEPRPITHAGQVLRERGPAARDRHEPAVVHQDDRLPRARCSQRARELKWHPPYMQARLENWINGLNGDWCVSRQRFFGVPFPVWYPVLDDGSRDYAHPIAPPEDRLPIDPSTDVPDGYRADQRDQPGGFSGDPDVMDTWATSSLDAAGRRAAGSTIRISSRASSRWTCVRRRTTSSAPGSSRRCCDRTSSSASCPGRTRRFPAGSSIRIARRCRSRRATSSRRWGCSRSMAPTASATGRPARGRAPTPRSIRRR